jgi:endo-alpha-1,4-polygalactosaminidase (GH114 family)
VLNRGEAMFGSHNTILMEIRDLLNITQANQRELIDLRERSIKMDQKVLNMENNMIANAEKAKTDDFRLAGELKEHSLGKFVARSEYLKDRTVDHERLVALETTLNGRIEINKKVLTAIWVTTSAVIAGFSAVFTLIEKTHG